MLGRYPATRASISRRSFVRGSSAVGLAALLAACSTKGIGITGYEPVQDRSDIDKKLTWSNWPFYLDVDEETGTRPSLDAFEEATGISVDYIEDVNDNDEYFAKIQPQLTGGQAIAADLFVVTDWMVAKLIRLGFVQEFDKANIPNAKNIDPQLENIGYDPGRKYSLTWQSGLAGIACNPAVKGIEVTSMDQLLTDPALRGKVTCLLEMRDTVGLTLLDLGYDPADFTFEQFDKAIAKLQAAVDSGQIRRFTGNDYGADLAAGNVAACVAWTGDVVTLQADSPDLQFNVPDAGCTIWSDNFVIPVYTPHKTNAEKLINWYYQPDMAALAADYINFISPVVGVREAMKELDPELLEDPLVFPDEATLAKASSFMSLTEEEENRCNRAFAKLTGA
ncbi:spermidine/putrescine ABC transporter substrate-binding protein [Nakamurella silvestris]|nr:spermidine/putrescine ABC transporter substrate-binding protein [Nakamurella silvestris]